MAPTRSRGYSLRPATPADLPLLAEHRNGMFRDMGGHEESEFAEHAKAYRVWARRMMRAGRFAAFIAEKGGAPVASGAVWLQDVQPRPPDNRLLVPYVLSMYTAPEHRGRGLAARIVKACVAWSKERGHDRVVLHAAPMGRKVYAKLGFERTWEMLLDLGAA